MGLTKASYGYYFMEGYHLSGQNIRSFFKFNHGLIHFVGRIFKKRKSIPPVEVKKQTGNKSFEKFETLIREKKLFLDPEISLTSMAERLHLSPGYLSQLINSHAGIGFNDLINLHRVNAAMVMLQHPDYSNYTVHAIALEAGFNTKSCFYRAFKKNTGFTPTEFKKRGPSCLKFSEI